jgi:hypothetical protein
MSGGVLSRGAARAAQALSVILRNAAMAGAAKHRRFGVR